MPEHPLVTAVRNRQSAQQQMKTATRDLNKLAAELAWGTVDPLNRMLTECNAKPEAFESLREAQLAIARAFEIASDTGQPAPQEPK